MNVKKILAFALVGVMAIPVPFIASIGSSDLVLTVRAASTESTESTGSVSGSCSSATVSAVTPTYDPSPADMEAARIAAEVARESELFAQVAEAAGASMEVYVQSVAENKSVGEYMNNAVTDVPGLAEATPVGQGGQVIIDGVVTNNNFSVLKPLLVQVQSAQAAGLGGDILSVVNVKGTASFETATVNFYMPGVTAEQNIQVYQLTDGTWNSVAVSEIREDHVVVDMTSYGVLAFVNVQ